mmetsp:Transcript_31323/g.120961  ORF Transcript_31323/g.120961 Transcript_31323/m.120961 type:complete len:202 (-) Transcript_31323:460-1065(-)|eukprot:CAMPEP_0113959640 /NCGR_PEP_ID=MMETSP0011_2-20120614/4259_1 /TAXON_ID=101924 /ORGANISM="Rhodosorus marinus" /LENGTH=201 /DNA_ID=CAMNT_0000970979 /DNA_START=62 /DNA_END=667 /DNA_ORIENTATION=- /assembly_acc=CAM_ASM_000156
MQRALVTGRGRVFGLISRGFKTSAPAQGGGMVPGQKQWEVRPPPMLPRRYNEDLRKMWLADAEKDFKGDRELGWEDEVDPYPLSADQANLYGSFVPYESTTPLPRALGFFFIFHFVLLSPIFIGKWYFTKPENKKVYRPPVDLPYLADAVGGRDIMEWRDECWKDFKGNYWTDFEGDNPLFYKNYTPGEVPTLEEAYPYGY